MQVTETEERLMSDREHALWESAQVQVWEFTAKPHDSGSEPISALSPANKRRKIVT
jgi:hypothetical protein